jgi:DNA modification methylase
MGAAGEGGEMTYTLLQGDCAEVMKSFDADSIDLTVTSPPYDNLRLYDGYVFDFETIAQQLYRVTKPGGVVVWVVGDGTINGSETGTSFKQALYFKDCGFNLHDTMIYRIPGTGAKGSNLSYWQAFEFMFIFSKGTPATVNRLKDKQNKRAGSITNGKNVVGTRAHGAGGTIVEPWGYRDNVWDILPGNNGDDYTGHPAPFPESLARDHILSWSNPGDLVLDPMAGSGTVAKMAIEHGRRSVNIEISPKYCDLIRKRLSGAKIPLGI